MTFDYSKGYKLVIKNFKTLRFAAKQAYLSGNYGLASSLNVLSSEELVKSLFVFIRHHNETLGIENFEKIFKNHKMKHTELEGIIKSSYKGIDELNFNILHDKEDFLNSIPEERREEFEKEYLDVERVKKRTDKIKSFRIPIEEITNWLTNSNDIKITGCMLI